MFLAARYYSRFPTLKSRDLHRGALIAQSFHVYLLLDRSREMSLQGRVQINIKLNYNDSVYRGAAHSRAVHRQPLFAMDGTNPATARLVIFYAMYINTAIPRGPRARVHVFVSGRFYAANNKLGCGRHVDVFRRDAGIP